MAISELEGSVVVSGATTVSLSQLFGITASSSDPEYLVLTGLDRNEYTVGATGATGSLSGNGHTGRFSSIGSDGRGIGIVFTYQASTGRYYSSTYGYLDQLTYTASASLDDVTSFSLYGTNSLGLASIYANNAYSMMQLDPSGYLGSVTIATEASFAGPTPVQATPSSIAAVAQTFVGDAWNENGCWTLASTISAEAGASLPITSTAIGVPGVASGEWIVAFNGPAGQSGNWQSMLLTGEMVVIGSSTWGHITTVVSGSGASAMVVDNAVFENSSGQVQNSANDGSAADIIIRGQHLASAEFGAVATSDVVIYELDTPIVAALVTSPSLAEDGSIGLSSLFSAADPASKAITEWQVYETSTSVSLMVSGVAASAYSAATAATVTSLSTVLLAASAVPDGDTIDARAYNGSYWGDWQSLAITVVAEPPNVTDLTASQTWKQGATVSLALAADTFTDPQGEALSYTASLANGQALPAWLTFNGATESFSGIVPAGVETLSLMVTATNTSGLSNSETFRVTVPAAPPTVTDATAAQSSVEGTKISLALPVNTFTDPQGETLRYAALQSNGQALPSWLSFNAATETFSGTAPGAAGVFGITVVATDTSGLSVSETFQLKVVSPLPVLTHQLANQTWSEGQSVSLVIPANSFTDPQGEALTYGVTLSNGQALPAWLSFDAATDTLSGTAPINAATLGLKVTATDTSGFSASEVFQASVVPQAPVLTNPTASQTWIDGEALSFQLASNTFTDPQGAGLVYAAYQVSGPSAASWLHFNPATDIFSGVVPSTASSQIGIMVVATNTNHLSATETFSVVFAAGVGQVVAAPVTQAATESLLIHS